MCNNEYGNIQVCTRLNIRMRNKKIFFVFLNQNICCGYSKEPSQGDGSFEHPKHMFKPMDKKFYANFFCLTDPTIVFVCLFDLIIYVPSTIFQLNWDRSSWVEPVLS